MNTSGGASSVRLGLRENWQQFALLVLINAFVGGMVGIERTVVPLIGAEEFGIASTTLVVSFIVSFGVVKALANLVSGHLADVWGRKRVLVLGWLVGLPVPFMIMWAPSWGWVDRRQRAARHQPGPCLVDDGDHEDRSRRAEVARPRRRPERIRRLSRRRRDRISHRLSRLSATGLRPAPIYLGIGYAVLGAVLSILLVRDTRDHVRLETPGYAIERDADRASGRSSRSPRSATAICSPRRRPASSTTSMTA